VTRPVPKRATRGWLAAAALAAGLATAGCLTASREPVVITSGISGVTVAGPQCPVERPGSPCPDRPISATIDIKTRGGKLVSTFTSDSQGAFRVPIEPGQYVLTSATAGPPTLAPTDITVPDGQFVVVTLTLDTGIR
jgi:hypothetical protein